MRSLVRALGVAGLLGLAALPACSGNETEGRAPRSEPRADQAEMELLKAHDAFVGALRDADVEGAAAFLDPSPELVLFPVDGSARLEGFEQAKQGLKALFRALGPAEWTVVHVSPTVHGGAGWLTYHFAVETGGGAEPLLGRGTEIWVRRADGWKLVHGHWSRDPTES